MKQLACRYAIVQFVPYMETGEFANVGVALLCPQTGFFDFKLETKKYARVTAFFNDLKRDLVLGAVKHIAGELERVQDFVKRAHEDNQIDQVRSLFTSLVHPREAIIRFGEARAILTSDPKMALNELFDHYVDHSFATSEYLETTMTRRLKSLLNDLPLATPFRPAKLGDDVVHANFELVQQQMQKAAKVIKAFNLNQIDPNSIYAHGDVWIPRVRRLQERGFLPEHTMFTVSLAPKDDKKRLDAGREIVEGLKGHGITVVDHNDESAIKEFALT